MSCVTKMMVGLSFCHTDNNSSCMVSRVCASSAPKGSSISNTREPKVKMRAMPTRWRMPPESCTGRWCLKSCKPTMLSISWARSSYSALGKPCTWGPKITFSHTVNHGNSAASWNTTPRSGPGACNACWLTCKTPELGDSKPAIRLSKVDLPQPEGPSKATKSPGGTLRSMRSSAITGG